MEAWDYLSDRVSPLARGILKDIASRFPDARTAVEEVATDYGWCPMCGSTGEVEVGGRSANDPARARKTCDACMGGSAQ